MTIYGSTIKMRLPHPTHSQNNNYEFNEKSKRLWLYYKNFDVVMNELFAEVAEA